MCALRFPHDHRAIKYHVYLRYVQKIWVYCDIQKKEKYEMISIAVALYASGKTTKKAQDSILKM